MERRMKLLILSLLTAILCLSAVTAHYAWRGADTEPAESEPAKPAEDRAAVSLYVENGLWGVKSATGRVLTEPTWYHLRIMSDTVLIARRNDGISDTYGLITTGGELLVPFLYSSFENEAPDLWIAALEENGSRRYHLYRADGTRWVDAAWDSCSYEGGVLTLTQGDNRYTAVPEQDGLVWTSWHTEHSVGLNSLQMEFSAAQLAALPPPDTLQHLGDAAADYLTYLFITGDYLDQSLLSAEDSAALRVRYLYRSCTLRSAEVKRVILRETSGFPSYTMLIQVSYRRSGDSTGTETVDTVMRLNISRNAAGAYTYNSFSDAQLEAQGFPIA